MLDLGNEALDQMTLFVEVGVVFPLFAAVAARRDDNLGLEFFDEFDETGRVVAFVGDQARESELLGQRLGLGYVVGLPGRQGELQRVPQSIDRQMYLGGESAPASP